ncbi:MAG: type II toxin-antitoxin system HicB family antitoxin [Firmicutes bacterium]|nr:type II toxin-antitoxin system HicB family antitoxin [Bacillota bacterium]
MKRRHTIQLAIRSGDESGYAVECVDFPVVTLGATIEESLRNLREAVELMLDGVDLAAWNLAPNPSIAVMIELEPDHA